MSNEIPPKRTESAEHTVVMPRESLPPVSTVAGMTVDQIADIERTRRDLVDERRAAAMDRDTMMPCPMCHAASVTDKERAYWLTRYPELETVEPPPSQPDPEEPPPSRPEAA